MKSAEQPLSMRLRRTLLGRCPIQAISPIGFRFGLIVIHGLAVGFWLISSSASLQAADVSEAYRLFKSGKYSECSKLTAQAIQENEYSETWRVLNIRSHLAKGEYAEALATLEAAIKRFPQSIRLRWVGHRVLQFNNKPDEAKKQLDKIAELVEKSSWLYRDATNAVVLGRFELSRGVDPAKVLKDRFNLAKKLVPADPESRIAAGQLALEKHDFAMAAQQLEEAAKLDPTDPEIHFGIARAYEPSDSKKTTEAIETALKWNPNHVDSLLFIVDQHVDAERFEEAAKVLEQVFAVNPHQPRGWSYRALLAHFANKLDQEKAYREKALAYWPANPEVDHLIGLKLSQKYRFKEGARHQRQALKFDSNYLPAKSQLAQDLLRLGLEEEGWKLAQEVYERDGYNIYAYNVVTLQDNMAKFRTLRSDGFILRMDPREAAIFGSRALELLEQAKEMLCEKYDVAIDGPVVVEIFPRQQDFAIRTFGMPGGAGFLGVCFGKVITANSPSSQGATPSNWKSVLWHEFCHVVTLTKTNNRMPRWLSEGISVYEEVQADPAWGQTMNPQYRQMILDGELTPVSKLSGAFLRPPSPMHLQFAYYESSLVVEYLVQQHGLERLKQILVDLGAGMPINETLKRHAGSLELLDQQFAEFAKKRAGQLAPDLDWEELALPRAARAEVLAEWLKQHPNNFAGLQLYAQRLIAAEKWQEAKKPLAKLIELYPDYTGANNALWLLAIVHRELAETDDERKVLTRLAKLDSDSVDVYLRLAELEAAKQNWPEMLVNAERILAVNPLIKPPHEYLAKSAEKLGNADKAIEAYQALLELEPFDLADVHYRLARQLRQAQRLDEAKRHVLMALEEAPRFREAHKMLLELDEAKP